MQRKELTKLRQMAHQDARGNGNIGMMSGLGWRTICLKQPRTVKYAVDKQFFMS